MERPWCPTCSKIVLNLIDRQAAEGVVDSEFQNEDVDSAFQMGGEPFQAAFGGAAGRAGVDHLIVQAGGMQLLRKQKRIGLAPFEHESVRQAVAKDENGFGFGR